MNNLSSADLQRIRDNAADAKVVGKNDSTAPWVRFLRDATPDFVIAVLDELLALREAGKEPVAEVVSKFGDPEAFGERDLKLLADIQKLPYGAKFYAAPQLPAVPDDTRRMDWLCSMVVDVREPLVYGSHSIFWSQCDSADDEPHHTTLREQIDAAIAAAPKPEE